jgi:hypothetical protein
MADGLVLRSVPYTPDSAPLAAASSSLVLGPRQALPSSPCHLYVHASVPLIAGPARSPIMDTGNSIPFQWDPVHNSSSTHPHPARVRLLRGGGGMPCISMPRHACIRLGFEGGWLSFEQQQSLG